MCEFAKNDVIKLARAILAKPLIYMDGDYTPYYFCGYCESELRGYHVAKDDFKHDLRCPVLVAQDVLTGDT
jgi:hypothetical protein